MQIELRANGCRVAAVEAIHGKLLLLGQPNVSVALVLGPAEIVDALDALEKGADALEPVGQLDRDRVQVNSPALLKVGELGDLQSVKQYLPTDPPGTESRRLPVVLFKENVMLLEIDSNRGEALEVNVLDINRRRFEDDLKL